MTEATKKTLSRLAYAVAHHDKNLWWELKRQIFEFGNQATGAKRESEQPHRAMSADATRIPLSPSRS